MASSVGVWKPQTHIMPQWKRVYLDANIFIYAVEQVVKDLYRPITSDNDIVGTYSNG